MVIHVSVTVAQVSKDNLRFAREAYANGDYYSAAYYYGKVLENDPSDYESAYWLADASRQSLAYKDAEKWYMYVYEKTMKLNHHLLPYFLGSVNKSLGRYEESIRFYNEYLNAGKDTTEHFLKKAKQEIASCIKALDILKDTLDVNINRLGEVINTPYSEFNPWPVGDTVLYFSSLRPTGKETPGAIIQPTYTTMIYKSNLGLSGYSEPRPIDSRINTPEAHNANVTFTPDKNTMYFSRCYEEKSSRLNCHILFSRLENERWSAPEEPGAPLNIKGFTSTQPAWGVNPDGQEALFFVSDRPGGQGGLDIWYAIAKDGKLNTPINAGSFLNTQGDEISPFYHRKDGTLYFSSDWTEGLGGYDIFSSKGFYSDWQKPVNLGYPINTSYNDIYFIINEEYNEAYLTSNRPGSLHLKGETCCNDLYFITYTALKTDSVLPEIVEDTTPVTPEQRIEELLPLTLYFHNDEPDPATTKIITEQSYETTLQAYVKLKDTYIREYSEGLSGAAKTQAQKDIVEFFDSYVLNGFDKLQRFAGWLKEDLEQGNTVQITVRGYCSPLNRGSYNVNLSKRRISSLINYIRAYENGLFMPYLDKTALNGGRLDIFEEPLGDMQSAPFVSNNPNDLRNSIYSRVAALERKVEIVMYNSATDSTALNVPEITFRNPQHNFGDVKKDERKTHIFVFRNTGKANLLVTGVETNSSALVTDWEAKEIVPGGSGVINVLFDPRHLSGEFNGVIYVTCNSAQGKIMLGIEGWVE